MVGRSRGKMFGRRLGSCTDTVGVRTLNCNDRGGRVHCVGGANLREQRIAYVDPTAMASTEVSQVPLCRCERWRTSSPSRGLDQVGRNADRLGCACQRNQYRVMCRHSD